MMAGPAAGLGAAAAAAAATDQCDEDQDADENKQEDLQRWLERDTSGEGQLWKIKNGTTLEREEPPQVGEVRTMLKEGWFSCRSASEDRLAVGNGRRLRRSFATRCVTCIRWRSGKCGWARRQGRFG